MKYTISLKIDCGERTVEANNDLEARQKAIIELYLERRASGITQSFHPIAEITSREDTTQGQTPASAERQNKQEDTEQ